MSTSSKRHTGTRSTTGRGSLRTLGKDTLGQLAKSASTSARYSGAWNDMPATGTTTPLGSSPENAPERPKVDIGPKAYKVYKSGARAVIRFFVQEKRGKFYVLDIAGDKPVAARTEKDGYATKREAVRVAREYRDKYGAYAKVPF